MENRDFVDSNRPGFLSLARGERSVVPVAMTSARRARRCTTWLAAAMLSALFAVSQIAVAGEGGTSHIMPGANATLVDLPPTSPGWFFKPMYINYQGDASARVPTAAGVVANLNADANTLVLGGGYGFEQTVLGGAHYAVAAFLPYTWLSISGNSAALGGVQIQNSVSGIGDLTVVPVMLAWKSGDWQYDFLLPVYAPTGSRQTALRVVLAQGPISRASTANYLVHYRTFQGATS